MPFSRTALLTSSGWSLMNRLSSMGTRQPLCLLRSSLPRNETLPAAPAGVARTITPRPSRTLGHVLLTNHVLSGALIGALARRPASAFAAGVASHFVLDTVPHWGDWTSTRHFLRAAVPDGLISLAAMGAIAALSPADRRPAVVAGMAGAALPDIDKPAKLFFGRSPFPVAVDRFHQRIQREAPGRAHLELLAAGGLAAAALVAVRRLRLASATVNAPMALSSVVELG